MAQTIFYNCFWTDVSVIFQKLFQKVLWRLGLLISKNFAAKLRNDYKSNTISVLKRKNEIKNIFILKQHNFTIWQ